MDGPLVPALNCNPVLGTTPDETGASEFHGGIHDDLLRAAKHRPGMIDVARCQPVLLAAHRLRQTEGDRQA